MISPKILLSRKLSSSDIPGHEQIQYILLSMFGIPLELVDIIFSYLQVTTLIDSLEFSFDEALNCFKNATFDSVKNELTEMGGFELKHDGTV